METYKYRFALWLSSILAYTRYINIDGANGVNLSVEIVNFRSIYRCSWTRSIDVFHYQDKREACEENRSWVPKESWTIQPLPDCHPPPKSLENQKSRQTLITWSRRIRLDQWERIQGSSSHLPLSKAKRSTLSQNTPPSHPPHPPALTPTPPHPHNRLRRSATSYTTSSAVRR